ncbi:MAG: UbiA prenyltransferase family protein [Planctomycetaceae bacterium]|jgi:4-hydroxybenzoate polyprenyltransferase|nr:UbiA prenyltransferase family protein [Planctomycetaceae bacterium]
MSFPTLRTLYLPPPPPILTAIPFQSDYLIENSHSLSELFVGFIRIARPKHWIKNSFVLAPLLIYPAAWSFTNFLHIILAFFCFCLWASSVYALNDVVDRHKDALHPRKSKRPIASGVISPLLGIVYFVVLALIAAAAAIQFVSYSVLVLGLFYLVNNLAYCFYFRNKVILDVMSIATGFVLRIFAGCLAVAVLPSNWMVVCGFSLAMLLGFGKRRLELTRNYEKQDIARKSLESYPIEFLNILLGVSSMMCLIAYMLYTISPETIAVHGTTNLLYTTPFVVYGVFRYSIRCIQGYGDGPVDVLTQDKAFIFNACAWVVSVGGILFFA